MAVRKLSGSWWVDFMYAGERLRKRSPLNTRAGATQYEVHLRQLITQYGSVEGMLNAAVPKPCVPTLDSFVPQWLREYVDIENRPYEGFQKRLSLRNHLLPAFGHLRLDQITPITVDRYKKSKRESGLSPKTVNNHISVLHRCLDKAREWEVIPFVPRFSKLPVGPVPFKYLRTDEVDALLVSAVDSDFYAMIVVAVRMGLRYSEIIALQWDDIDFEQCRVCVQRSEVRGHVSPPKNGRSRFVYMTSEVVDALHNRSREDQWVFRRNGRIFRYKTARRHLLLLCRAAAIRAVSWHALRHTFASELTRRGVSLQVVKDLLGHSTIEMTLRYAHVSQDLLRDAISTLEPKIHWQPVVNTGLVTTASAPALVP